jgi:hypothetical protein
MNHKKKLLRPPANVKSMSASTVEILHSGKIEIDEKLVPLIKLLWKEGYKTTSCCQGDEISTEGDSEKENGYISFDSYEEGLEIFDIVRQAYDWEDDDFWFLFTLSPCGTITFWGENAIKNIMDAIAC